MRFVTRLLATARELWPHYLAITICSVLASRRATRAAPTSTRSRRPRVAIARALHKDELAVSGGI